LKTVACSEISAAEILVAVGRKPRTEEIGLKSVEVEPGEGGFLDTDDRLRVGERDWLYAVGDVTGRALFTHMGKYQARLAGDVILGKPAAATAPVPRVTFTDPQVCAVGLTEAQAMSLSVNGFVNDLVRQFPMEYSVELKRLIELEMEGSVG